MRSVFLIVPVLFTILTSPLFAKTDNYKDSLSVLKREIQSLLEKNRHEIPSVHEQDIVVGFMINAKSELIIMDVNGDCEKVCNYVKNILSYKKVKFRQARQLILYEVRIHLDGEDC